MNTTDDTPFSGKPGQRADVAHMCSAMGESFVGEQSSCHWSPTDFIMVVNPQFRDDAVDVILIEVASRQHCTAWLYICSSAGPILGQARA